MSLNRIDPEAFREVRKNQAEASLKCVGYDYLSWQDKEQINRLLYVDDLTEAQWKQDREGIWNERLNHLDDIAVSLGYKPSELYKQDVLNAVMKVRGKEYEAEIKVVAEKKAKFDNRVSGRRMEYVKRGETLKQETEPRGLGEFAGIKTEPMKQNYVEPVCGQD